MTASIFEGIPEDERFSLARSVVAQGDEAGFDADQIAEAQKYLDAHEDEEAAS